jgi:hypothetical protein
VDWVCKPSPAQENQRFLPSSKSIFNKTIGDNEFELETAANFENFADVKTIFEAKNI